MPSGASNQRLQHVVYLPPDYVKAVLCLDPMDQMRMALVDVGVGFFQAAFGFMAGQLRQQHCMQALLLNWTPDPAPRADTLPAALQEVLGWSVQNNPLIMEYLTVAEQAPPDRPVPYLLPDSVRSFAASAQANQPLALATAAAAEAARSLMSVVVPVFTRPNVKQPPVMYTAGTLVPRNPTRAHVDLGVNADGTPAGLHAGTSAEMALFPYLFPFGAGAYMGGLTLVKYLAYRSKCLFSVWTLCKPYLLLMHVLRQSARLQEQRVEVGVAP
jgi:hypothetical protein